VCGDDLVDLSDQCDDGNTITGDCCSPTCTFEASCDGSVQAAEARVEVSMGRDCPLCNGANNLYLECPAPGDCADGLICTGSETCDPSLDRQAATLRVIDDGGSGASQSLARVPSGASSGVCYYVTAPVGARQVSKR
jgi:cysteine-rich repeat protein